MLKPYIARLLERENLSEKECQEAMSLIMSGQATLHGQLERRYEPVVELLLPLGEFGLQLAQLAVLNAGGCLQIAVALGGLQFGPLGLDGLAHFLGLLQGALLDRPAGVQRVELALQVGERLLQLDKALLAGVVGLFAEGLALDL